MRKALAVLTALGTLGAVALAQPVGHSMGKKEHKLWCQQNWEKCRQFRDEALKIKERSIARERDCLQKAKDFWAFEECRAQAKVQTKKEMSELRQRFMEGAGK
ncbi:MAG: hypothetical protein WHS43_07970 [Aquificaceae bacterium]|jgi:hypothetical protein|uniref:hypothetical protein n=1 Tax=Hydrogenobacter sp. Uz 6-8 TaxID=3384828 RepID=UPI000F169A6E|nr:MAG: hypothetical protein D6804_05265 [Aquificota bacterium]